MASSFDFGQPETQRVKADAAIECLDAEWRQREIAMLAPLATSKWVPTAVLAGWQSYRDAVCWCWLNQRHFVGIREKARQAMFASAAGLHAPHASRCLKLDSRAPMDLPDRCINTFESFTGWRGVRQWQLAQAGLTAMEQVIAERHAA